MDKIKIALNINKKTAFDWRYKINAFIENVDNNLFEGITESDETFFYILKKEQNKNKSSQEKEVNP